MTKDPFRHKTVLIGGADTPCGRALALQATRAGAHVILAGFSSKKIDELTRLIMDKQGDPLPAVLPPDHSRALTVLAEQRAVHGHVHVAVNVAAIREPENADFAQSIERARFLNSLILELTAGRGVVRLATAWPLDVDDPPVVPAALWHTLVRLDRVGAPEALTPDLDEATGILRPAAVADALLALLCAPPGACPVEVRLEPRKLKAG